MNKLTDLITYTCTSCMLLLKRCHLQHSVCTIFTFTNNVHSHEKILWNLEFVPRMYCIFLWVKVHFTFLHKKHLSVCEDMKVFLSNTDSLKFSIYTTFYRYFKPTMSIPFPNCCIIFIGWLVVFTQCAYRQGRIQDFHLGRGCKDYVCANTSQDFVKPMIPVQGSFKGPGSSRVFYALSCRLSLIFADTKWDLKHIVYPKTMGGGCMPAASPLDIYHSTGPNLELCKVAL